MAGGFVSTERKRKHVASIDREARNDDTGASKLKRDADSETARMWFDDPISFLLRGEKIIETSVLS
jgi:hypothetical protein